METTFRAAVGSCSMALTPPVWTHICNFLDIRSLMNMKESSRTLRNAVDEVTQALVAPFGFLNPDTRQIVVGRYFFATNTVVVLGLTDSIPLRMRIGKAVVRDVAESDEKLAAQSIKTILSSTVNTVVINDEMAQGVESMRYVIVDQSGLKTATYPFFIFGVENAPGQLSSLTLSALLGTAVEEATVSGNLLVEGDLYKPNSSFIPGDFASLQRVVHRRLVSFLAPKCVEHVTGYNETNPLCGAMKMNPQQCAARFGSDLLPSSRGGSGVLPVGSVVVEASPATLCDLSTIDDMSRLREILLQRVAIITNPHVAEKGPWPTSNPLLYCGTLPNGVDVVCPAAEVEMYFQTEAFHQVFTEKRIRHLYIVDNFYLSEVYHEPWYVPTAFLKNVLYDKEQRFAGPIVIPPSIQIRQKPLDTPWILWGSNGSFSSEHVEPHDSCVWVHLFCGLKKWYVFLEEEQVWFSFLQNSGQTVFMPRRTRHVVENLASGTFAIARNYFLVDD